MKQLLVTVFTAIILVFCSSCGMKVLQGEGKKTSVSRNVSSFDALDIDISCKINVTVREGESQQVQINGYNNILKHITTEVKEGTLFISFDLDNTWTVNEDGMELVITVPSLKAISLSGAPDVAIHGEVKSQEFKVDISGASDVVIDKLLVDKFSVDMSGASDLKVKGGSAREAGYGISGKGEINAYPLQTEVTAASISGLAECEVTVTRKLSASISGAGTITYKGNPEVTKHVSGVGTVTAADVQ